MTDCTPAVVLQRNNSAATLLEFAEPVDLAQSLTHLPSCHSDLNDAV